MAKASKVAQKLVSHSQRPKTLYVNNIERCVLISLDDKHLECPVIVRFRST